MNKGLQTEPVALNLCIIHFYELLEPSVELDYCPSFAIIGLPLQREFHTVTQPFIFQCVFNVGLMVEQCSS